MPTTYGRARQPLQQTPSSSSSYSMLLSCSSPSGPSSEIVTPPPSSPPIFDARRALRSGSPVHSKENSTPAAAFAAAPRRPPTSARQGSLKGFFAPLPKRAPLGPAALNLIASSSPPQRTVKRANNLARSPASLASKRIARDHAPQEKPTLAQTQLTHLPLLQSCRECGMSYVRGGDDEGTHTRHHARVIRGILWDNHSLNGQRKGKETAGARAEFRVVQEDVRFGSRGAGRGKVIMMDGSTSSSKVDEVLQMVDTVLSAPSLPAAILNACKVFLLVTSSPPPLAEGKRRRLLEARTDGARPRERVVGVVVSQPIKWAMRVLREDEEGNGIDSGGGVMCDPTPLPTPLGIHRVFVLPPYRSLGFARLLLDLAAEHTVYGCAFDPRTGEAAFSQPTESGRKVMEAWGGGAVRVFVDDESQV